MENYAALRDQHLQGRLLQLFERAGTNTLQLHLVGRHTHITIEPENIQTILATDQKKWNLTSQRKGGLHPLLGKGIFTTDGLEWQHSRRTLRPYFDRSQVRNFVSLEKHVSRLLAKIPRNGDTVDLSELFFRLTLDSATEMLFGESTDVVSEARGKRFAESFARAQADAAKRSQLGWLYNLMPQSRNAKRDTEFVQDFVDHYVEKGLSRYSQLKNGNRDVEDTQRPVVLEGLVRQTDDRVRIRSELLNILLAGRDTTASLLTNIWFILSKRPDLWRKLQEDVAT
ncbi:hypothetical protein JDV02_009162 [Purpureocillium takamizusanense]|uniref:Cytochrome P450 alkane hydroxylase n=1 Tax=Purpureocillium takamizusanense TaxID=2060973 RepID=A0A9Q8QLI5_9HYPO|nr:uncharacterized protein JDV02_009162 [Purpureocillium takamizusanense]UNI23334.1 hypothetical protein JDV02_009162 [Purpureocillium takamizusanense]